MRFLVIGAGFGENHLRWITDCEGASVEVLCYRSDSARARQVANRFRVPRVSNEPARIIDEGGIDAIVVASPPDTHEELLGLGLDAGLTVVSDKPLTSDVESAARLVERSRAARGRAVVTFQWRLNPAFAQLRELCAGHQLGTVVRVDLEFHHDFLAGPDTAWAWRHQYATAGAGTLGDQGVHLFDLLRWLVPDQWSVLTGTSTVVWPQRLFDGRPVPGDTEDIAEVLLGTPGVQRRARVLSSRASAGYRALRVLVQGTEATALANASPEDGSASLVVYSAREGSRESRRFGAQSMNPYRPVVAESSDSSEQPATFTDAYHAQVLMSEALRHGCGIQAASTRA